MRRDTQDVLGGGKQRAPPTDPRAVPATDPTCFRHASTILEWITHETLRWAIRRDTRDVLGGGKQRAPPSQIPAPFLPAI